MSKQKSYANDVAKVNWREKELEYILKSFSESEIRNLRVLCFPGKEMIEIFQIYDRLGIPRGNITGLEEDGSEFNQLRETNEREKAEGRGGINIIHQNASNFLSFGIHEKLNLKGLLTLLNPFSEEGTRVYEEHIEAGKKLAKMKVSRKERFDIVSLDYTCYFNLTTSQNLSYLSNLGWMSDKSVLMTNYQRARENRETQTLLTLAQGIENNRELLRNIGGNKERFISIIESCQKNIHLSDLDLEHMADLRVQASPIDIIGGDIGLGNTDIFKVFLNSLSEEEKEQVYEDMEKGQICSWEYLKRLPSEKLKGIDRTIFAYFLGQQSRTLLTRDHEAWGYVSNSNTSFISDFYLFERMFNVKLPENIMVKLSYKDKDGNFRIRGQEAFKREMLNNKKFRKSIDTMISEEHSTESLLSERQLINGERRIDLTDIDKALRKGVEDSEIREKYGLTKRKLNSLKEEIKDKEKAKAKEEKLSYLRSKYPEYAAKFDFLMNIPDSEPAIIGYEKINDYRKDPVCRYLIDLYDCFSNERVEEHKKIKDYVDQIVSRKMNQATYERLLNPSKEEFGGYLAKIKKSDRLPGFFKGIYRLYAVNVPSAKEDEKYKPLLSKKKGVLAKIGL